MAKNHILIVDDEPDIVQLLEYNLLKAGYACSSAMDGPDALAAAKAGAPDLILLDLMLPRMDGIEVCLSLKANARTRGIPVVMLTAKGTESDIVRGLEAGADDYVTKPFSPKVVVARVAAVLRRSRRERQEEESPVTIHDLSIHPGRHEALLNGEKLDLTHTEFAILHYLVQRPGWVFTRSQIMDTLHGPGHPVTDRAVDVQVVGLRKKLGKFSDYIETIRGVGYRFKE